MSSQVLPERRQVARLSLFSLHLAASEGLIEVVRYLVEEAGVNPSPVDRWGGTPLDDAIRSARNAPKGTATDKYDEVRRFLESKGATQGKTGGQKSSACVLL